MIRGNAEEPSAGWHRTAVDAGLAVVFAVLLVVVAAVYGHGGRPWIFDLVVGATVSLAALFRRRLRQWAAVIGLAVSAVAAVVARIGDLPGEPGAVALLALLVLGSHSVRTLPTRSAACVAVAGLLLMAVGLFTADAASGASSTLFRPGTEGWCVALAVGLWLRLRDYQHRVATESVRHDERLALARELHDVVAHHITGIVLQTQGARIIGRKRPEKLDETLAGIEAAGTDALAAMRRVVGLLRDSDDGATTSPAPEQLTELVSRFDGHGPPVRLALPDEPMSWPPEVTATVHRIVQESLTNIARHAAHARGATVDVAQTGERVTVRVTDDAPPGPARHRHPGGFGLIGMRERVEALGGTLRAGPGPDAGWSVGSLVAEVMPGGVRLTATTATAEDDRVVLEYLSQGVSPAGKTYDNRVCFSLEVRDGLIQSVREYYDTIHANDVLFDRTYPAETLAEK
ncbi:histidine kinase [Streptomyces sp. NPDC087851]|uniref:histidine kinase n=1 Tax=Streptomyces sp. NPDC087851 TaxID=3365810 RepID=UPI0037F6446B